MALRRMLVFEQVGEPFTPQNVAALRFAGNHDAPRRDKYTPCIKTNRLKRQNRSRVERAVRTKPLGESGPFFSHIDNTIFCPLFHGRIFSFLYQVAKSDFVFSACTPNFHSFTTPFHPLKTYFYHANYLLTHSRFSTDMCYAFGSSYHNRVRMVFNHDFKLVQSAHYDVLVCSFARVYDVYCSQHVITVCKRHCKIRK